ncbi:phosphonate degradation HD-domain oxygenase [Corynebacterium sp. A21]|uniref:phosphonate degradation HD-domain oxygenase n=1 Tax=Corynebacterium sp. A21 TaxID=3457318 RepID=UPI003FD3C96D
MSNLLDRSEITSPEEALNFLFDLFAARGESYYDEAVTQNAHALQTAALAERENAPVALVVAGLLHDVGHLIVDEHGGQDNFLERDAHHERIALRLLAKWFAPEVVEPITLHVAAKRYLVAKDPDYANGLSESSAQSLAVQGGPMSPAEAAEFEASPYAEDACRLRRWDDGAKVNAARTPDWEHYRPLVFSQITMH